MSEFELYMVSTIKHWGNSYLTEENEDIKWMKGNLCEELIGCLVKYELEQKGTPNTFDEDEQDGETFDMEVA